MSDDDPHGFAGAVRTIPGACGPNSVWFVNSTFGLASPEKVFTDLNTAIASIRPDGSLAESSAPPADKDDDPSR